MKTVPGIIASCARIGIPGAVIIAAGGKETGETGRRMEEEIKAAAAKSDLRIIGPNCLGIMRASSRLNASFASRMPLSGSIAFVSQSGAICTAILDYSVKEHIGFSHFISLGSMLDVDFGDVIDYLGADPSVKSIIMYVENLTRRRNFMSAARSVSRIKPIIALKAGRTKAGALAATSHTGAMAGEDAVYDAAFERAGVVRVRTFEELFDTAEILSRRARYRGPSLGIVTNSGGAGVMAADALADYGMQPAVLSLQTIEALSAVLPEHWSHANPVDIIGDATPQRYAGAVSILSQAREADALLVMLAPQGLTDSSAVANIVAESVGQSTLPILACWMGGVDVEPGREILNRAGLPTFDTPERAVRAFMNLHRHARATEMLQQIPPRLSSRIDVNQPKAEELINEGLTAPGGLLSEVDAKAVLEAYGFPVNPTVAALSAGEARVASDRMGYPVAMKILSNGITHKSEAAGVLLNLHNPGEVERGFRTLMDNAQATFPGVPIDGVTVQPQIERITCELIVGAKKDPDFGLFFFSEWAGVLAELLKDRAIALPPLNRLLASHLMEGTRVDRLLKGFRHFPPANREALEIVLIRLSQLVTDFPQIVELDINPLAIQDGLPIVLDARMAVKPATCEAPLHLVVSAYPAKYESTVHHPEEGEIFIRPIRPEDAPLLEELFAVLSPQSVYYRFFTPIKQLPKSTLARFTQIDYDREIALVAIQHHGASERILGAARIISQHNSRNAEFAVLVGDPWHGKGIGAHLLSTCLKIAKERQFGKIWERCWPRTRGCFPLGKNWDSPSNEEKGAVSSTSHLICQSCRMHR